MSGLGTPSLFISLCSNSTFSKQNITRLVNDTLQQATGWQDLSQRLDLLLNSTHGLSSNIQGPVLRNSTNMSSCIGADELIQLVPLVCEIIYGIEMPDVTGLGDFVGYTTQVWLNVFVFALLPFLKLFYLDEAPESFVVKGSLQGYYTVLTTTLTTNLIYAAWNFAASIHELTRRPALSTHWYLHYSNIVVFCMASLTLLISAFLLYAWEEYVPSMLVNVVLWIVVLGLFARVMVIDNWMPEGKMQLIAAACLDKHHEMAIPGIDLSGVSSKLWYSSTAFGDDVVWIPVGMAALFGLFISLAAIVWLVSIPLECLNNISIKEHMTRLMRWAFHSSASKPINETSQRTARSQNFDLEARVSDDGKVQQKRIELLGLTSSTLALLVYATTSTILLHNTRNQIMHVTKSDGDAWLFGQYGAVILWIPIVLEVIRMIIVAIKNFAFDPRESRVVRDANENHEMGPVRLAGSSPAHTASGSQDEQVDSESFNSVGRAF